MSSNAIAHCSYLNNSNHASSYHKNIPVKRNCILKRVEQTYKKFQDKPLPPPFKARLDGPSITWRVFSRLLMAIEYADIFAKDCMIFSFEEKIGNVGQRLFLVAHPEKMWTNHKLRPLEKRCTYEVIRENYPCKLYFDLEFYTCSNSEKNGNIMTEVFIKCVIAAMFEGHNLLLKESDFLWFDASNEQKFSCHLILQTKGVAFKNNIHAGTFVSLLTSTLRKRIEENLPSNELWPTAYHIKSLLVRSKKGEEIFFHDEGVYTKNRNFRLYLSTKFGKKSPLLLSPHNKYTPRVSPKYKEDAIFFDSLITYFRAQKINRILSYEEEIQHGILSHSFSRRMQNAQSGISGCSSSPFPELDQFVLDIIKDEITIGFIRKWTYLSNEQKIIYDIGNYRFCSNIGRHHKSNNIKIIVDMKAKCYYQTCLDPECRQQHFRSQAAAIPQEILSLNVPDDFFDGNCFTQLQPAVNNIENNSNDALHLSELFNTCSWNTLKDENDSNVNICDEEIPDCDDVGKTSVDGITCQEFDSNCNDFSEQCNINEEIIGSLEKNYLHPEVHINEEHNQETWDAFFGDDFTCSQEKMDPKINGNINEDFSFLNDEDSWDSEPVMKDSTVSLGNVSLEEEMLMAEAAEAIEATINGRIFSEETMF